MRNFTRKVCLLGLYLLSSLCIFEGNATTLEQLAADTSSARIAAAQVSCEGLTWTHGENLGKNDSRSIYTVIKENRIYISRDGADGSHNLNLVSGSPAMLYHLDNNRFPIGQYQTKIDNCINKLDPSTIIPSFLGAVTSEGIYCNGKLIKPSKKLGNYIGGDGVHTELWITTNDNILRVTGFRNSDGNVRDPNSTSYNGSLAGAIFKGENNSFFNWSNLGYTLNEEEYNGCFYKASPKYGTIVGTDNNCASSPVLNAISSVTKSAVNFSFTNGSGITSLNWKIKSGGTQVRNGSVNNNNGTGSITFAALNPGTYILEIQGGNCFSATSNKTFNIDNDIPPSGNCGRGPTITSISEITAKSLSFRFDGVGVPNIDWRIKQGTNILAFGRTPQLTSATVNIDFNSLVNGNYTLEIEGGDCNSNVDVTDFIVAIDPCDNAPTISSVSDITDSRLKVNLSKSFSGNLNWYIKNNDKIVGYGVSSLSNTSSKIIDFNVLPIGNYKLSVFIDGCGTNNRVAASEHAFNISSVTSRSACNEGPTLKKIISTSTNSIKFNFYGINVLSIDWKIIENKPGGQIVFQNRVELLNDKPEVFYPSSLANGSYKLQIEGGICSSNTTSMNFNIDPLPIHISNFSGTSLTDGIKLDWIVVDEKNGSGFDVLRLNSDSKNMESIGFVRLTDQKLGKYTFTDLNPNDGNNYYQLKQIDLDGSFIESRIINVKYEQFSELSVFPNPTSSVVNLNFVSNRSGNAIIETYGQSGVMLIKNSITVRQGINQLPISIEHLPNGVYLLRLKQENDEKVFRFVKSN